MSDKEDLTVPAVHEPVATYGTTTKQGRDWSEAELAEIRRRNQSAIEFLRSLRECSEEEAQEQRETWEFLQKALDEDRLSYRKLFP